VPPRHTPWIGAVVLSAVGLFACDAGSNDPRVPARIVTFPEFPFVFQGTTSRLTDSVLDIDSRVILGADVHYSSLDPALLTISAAGSMRSVGGLGTARVRATYRGLDTTVNVPILERVGTVEVQPESLMINLGVRADLFVSFRSTSGGSYVTPGLVGFTSANSSIATVNDVGYVFGGNRTGRTLITVAIDTFRVKVPVRVTAPP